MKVTPLLPDNRPQPKQPPPHVVPSRDQLPVVAISPDDQLAAEVRVLIQVRSEE